MTIEDGKFYFIKDKFFEVFKDYGLMVNKENGSKRPCYFCFKDRQNSEIIWFVPISTKFEKYEKIYEKKKAKSGKKPVYNFVFGNVLGKKAVFLIQNIFPTTLDYIEKKYTNSNKGVEIPKIIKENKETIDNAIAQEPVHGITASKELTQALKNGIRKLAVKAGILQNEQETEIAE